jgi:hypothetical protein
MAWLFRCVVKRIYGNRRKTLFLTKLIGLQCYVRDLATVQKERVVLIRSIWVGVIGSVGSALDLSGVGAGAVGGGAQVVSVSSFVPSALQQRTVRYR